MIGDSLVGADLPVLAQKWSPLPSDDDEEPVCLTSVLSKFERIGGSDGLIGHINNFSLRAVANVL
eukprot:5491604-Amphidinium_carterae.1